MTATLVDGDRADPSSREDVHRQIAGIILSAVTGGEEDPEVLKRIVLRAKGTPGSQVELALLIKGQDSLIQLATFILHRRAWTAELKAALGLEVRLEQERSEVTPEASHLELWRREN